LGSFWTEGGWNKPNKAASTYLSLKTTRTKKQQEPLKLNYNSTTLFFLFFFPLSSPKNPVATVFGISLKRIETTWEERKNNKRTKLIAGLRRSIVCDEALKREKTLLSDLLYTTPSVTFLEEGEKF
jgi:hypothetical protein